MIYLFSFFPLNFLKPRYEPPDVINAMAPGMIPSSGTDAT